MCGSRQFNCALWGVAQDYNSPVVNVSWNDAQAFCQWLGEKEDRCFRLPTEQNGNMCAAGTGTRFSNGDDIRGLARVGNVADTTAKRILHGYKTLLMQRTGTPLSLPSASLHRMALDCSTCMETRVNGAPTGTAIIRSRPGTIPRAPPPGPSELREAVGGSPCPCTIVPPPGSSATRRFLIRRSASACSGPRLRLDPFACPRRQAVHVHSPQRSSDAPEGRAAQGDHQAVHVHSPHASHAPQGRAGQGDHQFNWPENGIDSRRRISNGLADFGGGPAASMNGNIAWGLPSRSIWASTK